MVGGNTYSQSDYYSSNRLFFEISSDVPTIELSVPRLDKVLRNNDHVYFVKNIKELLEKIDDLPNGENRETYHNASIAAKYIEEKHTQYHRMKFKKDTVKRFIDKDHILDVDFPFFLP